MRLKKFLCLAVASAMVIANLSGIVPIYAIDGDGPTVKNDPNGPTVTDDGVILHKTARAVPGYANEWEVTLKVEAPVVTATSDTVIVVDRSNSMSSTMLSNAKTAATSLARQLLPSGNRVNRVAVLTFGTDVRDKTNGFSDSFSVVNNSINSAADGIQPQGGGTFTQGAIHAAAQLLASSDATYKNIVLLSDGVPSYSYGIQNPATSDFENGHDMIGGRSVRQFKIMDSSSRFNYNSQIGDGSRSIYDPEGAERWDYYGEVRINGRRYDAYYDHGNSAIAEANFFKATGGVLHTIAYSAGDLGNNVLNNMATPGKAHTSSGENLEQIFNDIAGEIKSLVESTHVHDVMGEGVYVDNATHTEELDWDPVFTFNESTGMYEATTSYRVSANEHMLDEDSTDGFHPLNKSASIVYNGKTAYFPVPEAKPFFINVTKELVGQEASGQKFSFEFVHPNGDKTTYNVESEQTHRIIEPFPVGTYSVNETGTTNNTIAFENYLVDYSVANSRGSSFQINEEHADHIDITITNTYETTSFTATKTWDDANDRDGFRKNYDDLYVVVKDGNTIVRADKISTAKDATNQSFSFSNLPKNRNGSLIEYTVAEARGCSESGNQITCASEFTEDNKYTAVIDNEAKAITNKHIPETTQLTIKKKWDVSSGNLPSVTPGFITVEVSNDKNDEVKTISLRGQAYEEWTGEFEGFKYQDGEEINYQVTEKKIGEDTLDTDKSSLYIYKDEVLEGKWTASHDGAEITNTWSPAKIVYTGAGEFSIKKLDQDGKPLSGVTFAAGNDSYTTGSDGQAKVEFATSDEEPDDKYTINVSETSAPDYYELIKGTETLEATTNLDLVVDEENLTNTYTKTFDISVKTPVDGYVWQADSNTLVVTNQALAKELKIVKTFEGLSSSAIEKESEISFDVAGPKGFTEMTVGIGSDECALSGTKLTCVISGDDVVLPVGEYSVTEKDAEIDNFTFNSVPSTGKVTKTVELGETATFEIKNTYETVNTASYKVKKVWEDDDNRDGIRPDTLEITLYADGEKYGSPVELTESEAWSYEWTELPLMNEDAEEIEYTAKEATVSGYESDDGVMEDDAFVFTNTHTPEPYNKTGELLVQKSWAGEGNELARPATISIELYGETTNDDGETTTWLVEGPVEVSSANDWKWNFSGLYRYENGKEISYSVQESAIGESGFNQDESSILVYEDGSDAIKGKWEKFISGFEITNTWTPAANVYNGEDEFIIKKIDQDGEAMEGVTFKVGDDTEKTDAEGLISVTVPEAKDEESDEFEYKIKETKTLEGYDLINGSATVKVTSVSELEDIDEENLINIYSKVYAYEVDGGKAYNWDEDTKTLTVVNNRSLAKSLTIRKNFSGVSESDLEGLTFDIEGPEDFAEGGKATLKFSEDCEVSEGEAICMVDVKVPTGKYTVTENGAEIKGYTLTVSGDNATEKTVEKDDEVVFEITNEYEPEKGGYGGDTIPPVAPDTGEFTKFGHTEGSVANNLVGIVATAFLVFSSATMFGVASIKRRK